MHQLPSIENPDTTGFSFQALLSFQTTIAAGH
jgi:hypothetical protein